MVITALSLLANTDPSGTVSVAFFKWAAAALGGAVVYVALAYQSLGKSKAADIAKLNTSMIDMQKNAAEAAIEASDGNQAKIDKIIERKDAVIAMLQNAKEQSDDEAFEKITNLLSQQTLTALSHQKYTDKMIVIMQETVDRLDDQEPLLEAIRQLLEDHNARS